MYYTTIIIISYNAIKKGGTMTKAVKTTFEGGIFYSHRKVIPIGNSLLISLPAQWLLEQGIKAGDILTLAGKTYLVIKKRG